MSMLVALMDGVGGFLFFLCAFLVVLTVVVFFHELGHFLVARWCGVRVSAFSIGFGKEICGYTDRRGTRWRLSWIPLGGYVMFMDDDNPASVPGQDEDRPMTPEERAGSFHFKPLWQRAAVIAAGPFASFLLAIVIFAAMFMTFGQHKMEPRISGVIEGTPAAAAGFKRGDLVLSINGRAIDSFAGLQQYVATSPGRELEFVVDRDGKDVALVVIPELKERVDRIAGKHQRPVIGIQGSLELSKVTHTRVGPVDAIGLGVGQTWNIITQTISYIGDVVMQRQRPDQIGGIIRIADASGKVAQLGPEYVVQFIAFISVSIGLINLFPILPLDGGHLFFYAVEAVRGRPLSRRLQDLGLKIGFALVLALMLFATYNDRVVVSGWLDRSQVENQSR